LLGSGSKSDGCPLGASLLLEVPAGRRDANCHRFPGRDDHKLHRWGTAISAKEGLEPLFAHTLAFAWASSRVPVTTALVIRCISAAGHTLPVRAVSQPTARPPGNAVTSSLGAFVK
jgi:hypothetical protein